jgi:tetratricopeptide (TPR) repeat protein
MEPTKKPAPPVADPGPSREEKLVAWAKANRKLLGVAAAALGLIVFTTWFLSVAGARKENFARTQLEQAWNAMDAGNVPLAAGELQKITTSYGGTRAAMEATLSLNLTRLLNGQNQLTADDLAGFLASNPPGDLATSARMMRGVALENLARHDEAAQAYAAAAESAPLDFQKAEALLGAARALRAAGKPDQAIAHFRTIIERYKETAAYPVAEARLAELVKGS